VGFSLHLKYSVTGYPMHLKCSIIGYPTLVCGLEGTEGIGSFGRCPTSILDNVFILTHKGHRGHM
jgi:hypothetical protein